MNEEANSDETKLNSDQLHPKEGESLKDILKLRGHLIRKDFHYIGETASLKFYTFVWSVRTLNSKVTTKYFGLYAERLYASNRLDNYFYFEELDDCVKALKFIKNVAIEFTGDKTDYKEIVYCSREGHRFGIYQVSGNQIFYINFDATDIGFNAVEQNNTTLETEEIDELIGLFEAGKDYLAKIAGV